MDSYFDIHNLAGIDFVNMFHKVDQVIITEEIYLKNIAKIKKYKNISLAIDSDNLPWCAEDIKTQCNRFRCYQREICNIKRNT